MKETKINIEQQFAELPLKLKEFAVFLSVDELEMAKGYCSDIKSAIAYISENEFEAEGCKPSQYILYLLVNLSCLSKYFDEFIYYGKKELFKRDVKNGKFKMQDGND